MTYRLDAEQGRLFQDVLDYCRARVSSRGGARDARQRVRHWAAIVLLRCVLSSPCAAATVLARRAGDGELVPGDEDPEAVDERFWPDVSDAVEEAPTSDLAPSAPLDAEAPSLSEADRRRLNELAGRAKKLEGPERDPKLAAAIRELETLLRDGFWPIVFCRFVPTALYVAQQARSALAGIAIEAVTGALAQEVRAERIEELARAPRRILVATDCLSEGINLQEHFDAVLHYDLPWNPNRHEQREGRVDLVGQTKPEVETVVLYGADNEVDLAVLEVLVRKARRIREDLGVAVPVPAGAEEVLEAVVSSVLLRRSRHHQLRLDLDEEDAARSLLAARDRAVAAEREVRIYFAQEGIRFEEIERELAELDRVLGDPAAVERLLKSVLPRFEGYLRPAGRRGRFLLHPGEAETELTTLLGGEVPVAVCLDRLRDPEAPHLGRTTPSSNLSPHESSAGHSKAGTGSSPAAVPCAHPSCARSRPSSCSACATRSKRVAPNASPRKSGWRPRPSTIPTVWPSSSRSTRRASSSSSGPSPLPPNRPASSARPGSSGSSRRSVTSPLARAREPGAEGGARGAAPPDPGARRGNRRLPGPPPRPARPFGPLPPLPGDRRPSVSTVIRLEGGLFDPNFLDRLSTAPDEIEGQKPEAFGLEKGVRLAGEIQEGFTRVLSHWRSFERRRSAAGDAGAARVTRESWVLPLFRELGFEPRFLRGGLRLAADQFPITHAQGDEQAPVVPIHLVPFDHDLDLKGDRRTSPHGLLQSCLDRTDLLWGIVTNGRRLRLLRASTHTNRQAFLEADLEAVAREELYPDFALLFRLLHRSRFPESPGKAHHCPLERWYQKAIEEGGRVRENLRQGVEEALEILGSGFLAHPQSRALREALDSGRLSAEAFRDQLLATVYRLLFLLTAEERRLLARADSDARTAGRYAIYERWYGISRLRTRAERYYRERA